MLLHRKIKNAAMQLVRSRRHGYDGCRTIQNASCKVRHFGEQTDDEESRQRYLRLEQTYLHLAESEDQLGQMGAFVRASKSTPAA